MDIFLDVGDGLCLSDMVDGDIKYSLEIGFEVGSSGRSSPGLFNSDLWSSATTTPTCAAATLDSSCCSLDPLDPPGIMVDPAAVVPRRLTETLQSSNNYKHNSQNMREEYILPKIGRRSPEIDEDDNEDEEEVIDEEVIEEEDEDELIIRKVKEEPPQRLTNGYWPSSPRSRNGPTPCSSASSSGTSSSALRRDKDDCDYPKPAYSYSCLIALALKNSSSGSLPVSAIYNFMCDHFPYFKSAPSGWKNSVRHNLSLNKCFEKIDKTSHGGSRKGCLWALHPNKVEKMDEEVAKWSKKDRTAIRRAMRRPETLDMLERGEMKVGQGVGGVIEEEQRLLMDEEEEEEREESEEDQQESDEEEDEEAYQQSEDEGEVPPSLKPFEKPTSLQATSDIGVEFGEEVYEELGLLEEVVEEAENSMYLTPVKRARLEHCYRQPIASHQ